MLKHIGLMSCFLVRSRRNTIQFSSPQQNKGESPQGEIRKSETKKKKTPQNERGEEQKKKRRKKRKKERQNQHPPEVSPLLCITTSLFPHFPSTSQAYRAIK